MEEVKEFNIVGHQKWGRRVLLRRPWRTLRDFETSLPRLKNFLWSFLLSLHITRR